MNNSPISRIEPGDGKLTNASYRVWKTIIPLPPASLLWSVGAADLEKFLVVGDAWTQLISRYLMPESTALDLGCGCGRLARSLVNHPFVKRYVGFDVIAENVEWCNGFIASAANGRAEFHHYDLYSAEYNPGGRTLASELVFPCADGEADMISAMSVFTHLLEPDAIHYLAEVGRSLSPRGHALLSIHTATPAGCRFSGNESRIDIQPEYFAEMCVRAGLEVEDWIERLCGQHAFILKKRSA
jgi:SAM-dependent methyltransferase